MYITVEHTVCENGNLIVYRADVLWDIQYVLWDIQYVYFIVNFLFFYQLSCLLAITFYRTRMWTTQKSFSLNDIKMCEIFYFKRIFSLPHPNDTQLLLKWEGKASVHLHQTKIQSQNKNKQTNRQKTKKELISLHVKGTEKGDYFTYARVIFFILRTSSF